MVTLLHQNWLGKFVVTLLLAQLMLFIAPLYAAEGFILKLDNADIDVLIRTVADRTGKNFVIDPKVKGKVTVVATQPMNKNELYQVFLSILQVHGYTAVKSGEVIKIIPAKEAKQTGGLRQLNTRRKGDEFVTKIIKLTNSSATQVVSLLRPLVPKDGHIAASADSNVLIISDRAENVARLSAIVSRIDNAGNMDVKIIHLQHASASEMSRILNTLLIQGKGKFGNVKVIEDGRTNSIIVSANKKDFVKIRNLVSDMDSPSKGTGNAQVIYLKYSKAETLVPVLLGVSDKLKVKSTKKGNTSSNKDISIQADKNSNSLIITAPHDLFNSLKGIVRKLDIRRAQVLVEAVIAEVSLTTARELGVEWVIDGTPSASNAVGFINFGSLDGMIGAAASIGQGTVPSLPTGTTLGFGSLGGSSVNFAAFLRALSSDSSTNILSTPSILTLDNADAEIVVGENVPFISGEYTSTGGTAGSVNPFRTINREDVGLSLKVTPQINEGNAVQLEIEQEITNVIPGAAGASDLTTSKRRIKTTVLVEDQEIVVLGGLIDESLQESQSKVPFLGDIPFLGALFRYDKVSKIKRNLMVFIKPVIIRDDASISQITGEKYSYLRAQQLAEKEAGIALLPDDVAPVLAQEFVKIPSPFNYTDSNKNTP